MPDERSNRRLLASAIAATLVFAACGDDDSAGGGSIDEWCAFAVEAEAVDAVFNSLGDDPTAIESGLQQVKQIAERLPQVAPSEVADDAKVFSDGTLRLVGAFEDADFNIVDADLSILDAQQLQTELDTAGDNLDRFTQRECGRAFGTSDSTTDSTPPAQNDASDDAGDDSGDDSFDPSGGTLREQLVEQFESIGLTTSEANCIADNLDFNDPAVQSGDIAAMLDVFGTCDISLERLTELGGG